MPASLFLVSATLTQPSLTVSTGAVVLVASSTNGPPIVVGSGLTSGTMTPTTGTQYSYTATGLAPGSYTAVLTETVFDGGVPFPNSISVPFVIADAPIGGCTDPNADNYDPSATQDDGSCAYTPPPRHPYFVVPLAGSLRFVQPNNAELPTFDNTLLADETPLDYNVAGYCQKVERGDTLVLQFLTNYGLATPTVEVVNSASTAVLARTPVRIVQSAPQTATFEAYLRPDTNPNRLRVYFNSDTLPYPFLPTNRVTIGAAGSVNGTYPIVSVLEDPAANAPYLVLPVGYPGTDQRIDCELSVSYAVQAFDTWQVVVPFNTVPVGCYNVRIRVTDAEFGTGEALSEPIDVAVVHPDTVLIQYRNFDNAYGLNYSQGLVNQVRVLGRFFQRENPTQKVVNRETTGRLVLLSGAMQRRIVLETFQLPDWEHEKLTLAFVHDSVKVQGVKVVPEGEYATTPVPRYTLKNGTISLEQEDFLTVNRDDIGDVDGNQYLLVEQQFLAINP